MTKNISLCSSASSIWIRNNSSFIDDAAETPFLAAIKLAMHEPTVCAQAEVVKVLQKMTQDFAWRQAFPCILGDNPARYCLYQGEHFTLNVLTWRQRQVGGLRGQLGWSAFTVLEGELVQRCFSLGGKSSITSTEDDEEGNIRLLEQGAISLISCDEGRAYRLANLGGQPALSLHVEAVPEMRRPNMPLDLDYLETGVTRLRLVR